LYQIFCWDFILHGMCNMCCVPQHIKVKCMLFSVVCALCVCCACAHARVVYCACVWARVCAYKLHELHTSCNAFLPCTRSIKIWKGCCLASTSLGLYITAVLYSILCYKTVTYLRNTLCMNFFENINCCPCYNLHIFV